MHTLNLASVHWRKSSYSNGSGADSACVEVAFVQASVAVRDSKAPSAGQLAVPASAWRGLLIAVR